MKKYLIFLLLLLPTSLTSAADRPNILWLTSEDNSVDWVGCYGNPYAETPNIDALSAEGFQYMHCYANAPVCAPSRSTWITGVHALSMGTHPMRSRYPIPHETIKYNSGTHCPLIIRIPEKFKHLRPAEPGTKINDLVSFIDMTKTWLNICGAEAPDYLQGKVFLGQDKEAREYHVSYRTRMDERCDNVRAIRDTQFLYIRNYMPYAPTGQHLNYLWTMRATQAWEQHHKEGKTNSITGRFFETKPMEELYDTSLDPDNVNNLIDDPKYAPQVTRLSQALDRWQLEHYDSGLLPESEVVRRSEQCGKTIYEMVREPELYDLPALQRASSRALEQDPANLASFYENLNAKDAGVRYWAVVGCFNLQKLEKLDLDIFRKSLADESHHVRVMAAWILYRGGDKPAAQGCWNQMLRESSYASLMIFNVIDWIGEGVEPYAEAMKACQYSHGGYVARMQQYMGIMPEAQPKRRQRNNTEN